MRFILLALMFFVLGLNSTSAQCFGDRHNANTDNSWLSCSPSENPNSDKGNSHWIMYNLGGLHALEEVIIWNYNHVDNAANGIQTFTIDLSIDGEEWLEMGTYSLDMSTGSAYYEGDYITNLNKQVAQYILLTATENHGGTCYGFSELKVTIGETTVPLDLLSFSVMKTQEDANLAWVTENEISIDKYNIQRSTDEYNWENIGSVKSKNLSTEYTYNYSDRSIFNYLTTPYVYYRLEIVNADGSRENSEIKVLRNDLIEEVSIYPNPTSDMINISQSWKIDGAVIIDISNLGGRLVQHNIYYVNGSVLTIPLNEELINGEYYLSVYDVDRLILKEKFSVFR